MDTTNKLVSYKFIKIKKFIHSVLKKQFKPFVKLGLKLIGLKLNLIKADI